MKKNVFLFAFLFFTLANIVNCQTRNYRWAVGANLGLAEYYGDLGNGLLKFDFLSHAYYHANTTGMQKNQPGFIGVTAARYQNSRADFALGVLAGNWGYYHSLTQSFSRPFAYADATFRWKFMGKDYALVTPYLLTGVGYRYVDMKETNDFNVKQLNDLVIPVGIGMNIRCKKRFYINVQSYYGWTNHDIAEGSANLARGATDQLWHHSIGFTYLVCKMRDADGDGIADKYDRCAGTPPGALVDKNGCIVDADNDGIADNLDNCPAKAGIARFSGCPDTDGDGVEDRVDRCVNTAGTALLEGCPDTDGDGIEDSKDKCPAKAGIAAFGGCPDTDGDGVEDAIDQCPNVKGTAVMEGCPDTDGDGLQDNLDQCPTVAGIAANKGCPEVKAEPKPAKPKKMRR